MLTTTVILDSLSRVHELVPAILDGLELDDVLWQPDKGSNSIGWLIWHLTRVEDNHLADLAGRGQVWLAQVIFCPGKASNAGGVAVSGLEMAQDSQRLPWTFDEVDQRLQGIMKQIVERSLTAAHRFDLGDDLFNGANIAGFDRVVGAMLAEGVY